MRRGALALWRSALGLAALALMLVGCDATAHNATPAHHSQATATAAPPKMLDWRKIGLPPGVPATEDSVSGPMPIATIVSPVNGHLAWVCAPGNGASFQVWFTQDAGATWRQVGALTPTAPLPITACVLTADRGNADALAANFGWSSGNGPTVSSGSLSYYSSDDGASWRQMPQNDWVAQVATVGGATYAMLISAQSTSLVVSGDHLTTWHSAQQPPQNTHAPFQFWAASASGELLLANMNGGAQVSDDAGASWGPLPPPQTGQAIEVTVAAWLAQSSDWRICGYEQTQTAQDPMETRCTADRGKTWASYPPLTSTWECGHCARNAGPNSGVNPCLASAITASGALYAICGNDPQDSGKPWAPWTISRLSPGASTWATVGLAPCTTLNIAQSGQAWCNDARGAATYILDQLP